jgi:hypothetical protein
MRATLCSEVRGSRRPEEARDDRPDHYEAREKAKEVA